MLYLPRLRFLIVPVLILLISACTLPPFRQLDLSHLKLPKIDLNQLTKMQLALGATKNRMGFDPQPVQADSSLALPERIAFAPAAAAAKVIGVLHPGKRDYLVRALAGQQLVVNLASLTGQAHLTIRSLDEGEKLQEIGKDLHRWTTTVPTTQEYLVTVNTDTATPFELVTTLDQGPAPLVAEAMPVRILFASGSSSTTITKQVASPERHRYLLRGVAGQTLQINLAASDSRADFAVQGITDGRPLKRLETAAARWANTLPLTQDYLITVASAGEAVNYVMELGME